MREVIWVPSDGIAYYPRFVLGHLVAALFDIRIDSSKDYPPTQQ
jgi:hypothetical protein